MTPTTVAVAYLFDLGLSSEEIDYVINEVLNEVNEIEDFVRREEGFDYSDGARATTDGAFVSWIHCIDGIRVGVLLKRLRYSENYIDLWLLIISERKYCLYS